MRKYSQEEIDRLMRGKWYFNPDDSNIIVRRTNGWYSYVLNLGNKWAWVLMGAAILVLTVYAVNQGTTR